MRSLASCTLFIIVACGSGAEIPDSGAPDATQPVDATTNLDAASDSSTDSPLVDAPQETGKPKDSGKTTCKPDGGGLSCYACCDVEVPGAKDQFRAVLSNCMPANCPSECTAELSGAPPFPPPTPGSACESCVFGLGDAASSCVKQMKTDCGATKSCSDFVQCMDDCVRN